jgi:uncharacterized NAD(P)/FAD-binding protein YdhS
VTRETSVVVIGGGFSGAMTAAHLAGQGIATTVIEPGRLGRGVAYAATGHPLLLNVRASAMTALPGQPLHFESWLERRAGVGTEPRAFAHAFVPRAVYGEYLEDTVAEVSRGRLDVIAGGAVALAPAGRGFAVRCADGEEVRCQRVVLALGNPPPRTPAGMAADVPGYAAAPYARLSAIEATDPVAILGTGLTSLDVIAGLRARGHRGRITCISRRGLVPAAHGAPPRQLPHVPRALVRQPRLRTLLSWWRTTLIDHPDEAALIAGLRPLLPTIWRRLPLADRARFLRHVRPRWDVLRHRAPPSVRATLDLGVAEGSIEIVAGHLVGATAAAAGLRCQIATAEGTRARDVRWLLNCTGPERDIRRLASPLMQSLVAHRLVAADPLGLGVLTGPGGQLIGEDGLIADAYVVGPWRMADLFEASAVPELRGHALETAMAIVGEPAEQRVQVAV